MKSQRLTTTSAHRLIPRQRRTTVRWKTFCSGWCGCASQIQTLVASHASTNNVSCETWVHIRKSSNCWKFRTKRQVHIQLVSVCVYLRVSMYLCSFVSVNFVVILVQSVAWKNWFKNDIDQLCSLCRVSADGSLCKFLAHPQGPHGPPMTPPLNNLPPNMAADSLH